jgi:hypothetical protein
MRANPKRKRLVFFMPLLLEDLVALESSLTFEFCSLRFLFWRE